MLRVVNILGHDLGFGDNEEKYEEIHNLLKKGHEKFRYNDDEMILFHEYDKAIIEEYLQIKFPEDGASLFEDVEFQVNDSGDWFEPIKGLQIDKSDCFKEIINDFGLYEDRIWSAGTTWMNLTMKLIRSSENK
ncbi:hypothetical protein [Paenibacillus pini]|uniref:Uncharacterized protein n=1 Tax=Paenibacillus pini JCM 16418 TaxID=1236976 RepID=W7Z8S2_9BACL|nr:hypothetical protein [Paenibacillus pini]GAF10854.1 hypothetical protein JCM16418_5080 [Paenibacillus pini JCM 16418]